MNTTSMVTMIERLLPRTQKREWVTRMDQIQTSESRYSSTFETLLSYLLQEKIVIEFMDSDVRGSTSSHVKQLNQTMAQVIEEQHKRKKEFAQKRPISSITNERCWVHDTDSHAIYACTTFLNLSHEDKLRRLRQSGVCFNCLQQGHIAATCPIENQCEKQNQFNQKCGKRHHPCLHIESRSTADRVSSNAIHMTDNGRQETLLAVSHVRCKENKLSVLWDSGANVSLITHDAASRLNLTGDDVQLSVTKVGN